MTCPTLGTSRSLFALVSPLVRLRGQAAMPRARRGDRQGRAGRYPVVVVVVVVVVAVVVTGGGFFFFLAGAGFVPTSTSLGWLRYDEYHVLS